MMMLDVSDAVADQLFDHLVSSLEASARLAGALDLSALQAMLFDALNEPDFVRSTGREFVPPSVVLPFPSKAGTSPAY
ncbi:hypothetical protein OKW76_12215 [Sphingomonas sp. S1-29]|uniref:hypothetical protein n=1 Tax=Sphingomonas sp. S1-29 TaxID=2991074 RepID=UPI00223EC88F|nr:hypothetical protein [Sphingomonas sp. S1-29]UZK68797.1 hypothetical protein OKW76_12215 [Sphingomonas sp. S1-29]